MPITTKADLDKQLTIHTVTGEPSFEEGMEVFKSFYKQHPTKNVLWDLRSASLQLISSKNLEAFVDYAKGPSEVREGGKTAFIVSKDLEYGMSRMIETFTEIKDIPIKTKIFQSIEEAIKWIDGEE